MADLISDLLNDCSMHRKAKCVCFYVARCEVRVLLKLSKNNYNVIYSVYATEFY